MQSPYRLFWVRFTAWVRRSLNVLWLVLLAGYLFVLAGRSVYQNYQDRQQTASLQAQLVTSEQTEQNLQALVGYYQTESYKDQALRQDLLLQEPGEKVFALPESSVDRQPGSDTSSTPTPVPKPQNQSIPRQWFNYLRHSS